MTSITTRPFTQSSISLSRAEHLLCACPVLHAGGIDKDDYCCLQGMPAGRDTDKERCSDISEQMKSAPRDAGWGRQCHVGPIGGSRCPSQPARAPGHLGAGSQPGARG